jgi:hypothetical protein
MADIALSESRSSVAAALRAARERQRGAHASHSEAATEKIETAFKTRDKAPPFDT